MKAYSSCVGEGPFTAELAMTEEEKHALRESGHEYGAATGRPRRVGPFDAVASRYGVECQGADILALTLLDVLDYMDEIPVVEKYLVNGQETTRFPMGGDLDRAMPIVKKMPVGSVTSQNAAAGRPSAGGKRLHRILGESCGMPHSLYFRWGRPRSVSCKGIKREPIKQWV